MLKKLPPADVTGRRLVQRPGVGTAAVIVQDVPLAAPHLSVVQPGLVRVLSGTKEVRSGRMKFEFGPGTIALFAGGQSFDVTNSPADDVPYRAEAIFFETGLLPPAPAPATRSVTDVAGIMAPGPDLLAAFESALAVIADQSIPLSIARHRLAELLLWLNESGLSVVAPRNDTVAQRVRALLSDDPARSWTSAEVAAALSMSEATFRRRLADNGTSWTALLQDIRLTMALTLLQSTDDQVVTVALRVGYESPSRFAARFRERFGLTPSQLRETAGP